MATKKDSIRLKAEAYYIENIDATQKEVAAHLEVPHSAISDIENGKRDVTVGELKILSHLYGRSVEEIMSGKKYDYYNIANIARLLTELPDEDLKEVMFIIEYKRKRLEEKSKTVNHD